MSEAEFQETVVALARLHGWRCLHVRRSIGKGSSWTTSTSVAGWPDITAYRPAYDGTGELLFAELKSETGRLTAEQEQVHDDLRRSGQEVYVWRPSDLDTIARRLGRHRAH